MAPYYVTFAYHAVSGQINVHLSNKSNDIGQGGYSLLIDTEAVVIYISFSIEAKKGILKR